jgi:multiple sugar transport system permease protein
MKAEKRPAKRGSLRRREAAAGLLFVTPQIIHFFVFFLFPLCLCVYAAFTNWNILSPKQTFVAFRNFQRMFADPKFWIALKNTFYYLIPIPFYMVLSLAFAHYCHTKKPGERTFRVIYYLPYISSIVALTLIWKWLFNSQYGIVNNFLALFGISGPNWLGDPVWTRRMIVFMIAWKMIGITSIYYIAALKNVPVSYYEAARIDGASSWQQFRQITLPLITPTTFYLLLTCLIGSLQTFLEVQLFTEDGGRNYGVASVIYYVWQKAFQSSQMGYACAAALVFGSFIMIVTIIQFVASRKWVYEGE